MNRSETAMVLAQMQAYDQRTIGDADVIAWHSLLSDAPFEDCQEAVRRHYAEQTDRIMPAHIRRIVRDIHTERLMIAGNPYAPGQWGVPKDEAMPTGLRPTAEEAGQEVKRMALSDLPAGVAALVEQVRAGLPEGAREELMPRRVVWEREHQAYLRHTRSEPNPHYRGGRGHSVDKVIIDESPRLPTVHCPLCTATSQDLPAHMADYHQVDGPA